MSSTPKYTSVKAHIRWLLGGGHAHLDFDRATADMPTDKLGDVPAGMEHSVWQLAEHMRRAQTDVLEFSRDSDYESPAWPEGYWPDTSPEAGAWEAALKRWHEERKAFIEIVDDADDALAELPHAPGYTLLRNALVISDHDAYHLGQIVMVRKALGCWE